MSSPLPVPPTPPPNQQQQPSSSSQSHLLSEIITEAFPAFDHQSLIVTPFENEATRDTAFEQELSAMILDLVLETHAWSAARPKHESQVAVQRFEGKISSLMQIEKEQEKTRERLAQFVAQMKTALAALTGLGL